MRVVTNTSPLIVLERIGRLDLLRDLYGEVIRPMSVLRELREGSAADSRRTALTDIPWLFTEEDPPATALRRELGAGETAAITLAYLTKADLVLLDDLQARLVARQLQLRVTGTLGVLVAARAAGLMDDLPQAVSDLEAAGFRLAPEIKRQILASA